MTQRRFFVTGDEWGLVDVVPAENAAQFEHVRRQIAEHHQDSDVGPYGWTTPPFLIPAPATALATRSIPLPELGEAFAGVLVPADVVETCEDFTGPAFIAPDCFAWAEPTEFHAGF